jgi:hypothetical protein
MKINIPASIDEAHDRLGSLGKLLTATEWEKAAIVAAFVGTPGKGGSTELYSTHQFAGLKITGLKSAVTVQRYVDAWEKSGEPKPKPGHAVALPTADFSEVAGPAVTSKSGMALAGPTGIAKSLEDDDNVTSLAAKMSPAAKRKMAAAIVDQQTLDDPAVKQKVRSQVAQHDDTASKTRPTVGSPVIDALDQSNRSLTNSHLMESFGEFRKFKAEVESGEWVINDRDASVLDRFITDIAAVAASVKFEEAK